VFPEDRFLDVASIGAGANASVFRAFDRNLRRHVALKISAEDAFLDAVDRDQLTELGAAEGIEALLDRARAAQGRYTLLREARLLARVNHPNVIPVIEVGRLDDGAVAVVMPLLSGGALPDQHAGARWQDVLGLALAIGEGLAAIHEAGLVHRDLKPANILFDEHGRPRIADLGLACEIEDLDAIAERVGTPQYMPPEALRDRSRDRSRDRPRDRRDDIYAYCMIVWEMLYGHSPFASIEARLRGEVSDIRRPGGMSAKLREILVKGLHPDLDERWPDMEMLLARMRELVKPRRRWGSAALGVAAALTIGVLASTTRTAEADACEQVATELAQIWTDEIHAELETVLGTRMAGDGLQSWVGRWVALRSAECQAAKREGRPIAPSPCAARMRDQFRATVAAFRTPRMREGLRFAAVIAELPAPEHCIDDPGEGDRAYARLGQMLELDVEVGALTRIGDLDAARLRQRDYMDLARAQSSEHAVARASFWHAELLRREGRIDEAEQALEAVYRDAQRLGAQLLGVEATIGLIAIAGERGDIAAADAYALFAAGVLSEREPERIAWLFQVHGLALMSGPEPARARGLELLAEAVALREAELRRHGGTRELLSQAHESYASALLDTGRDVEALDYLARAQEAHQTEFGHGTWRLRVILREKFRATLRLGRVDAAESVEAALVQHDVDREDWSTLTEDVVWLAGTYVDTGWPRHAAGLLHTARSIADRRHMADLVRRFDRELAKLEDE
jgi:tetratricopeptide (TPR) repeat protein